LLLKNLDKFYNNLDIPWFNLIRVTYYDEDIPRGIKLDGSFWWKAHLNSLIHIKLWQDVTWEMENLLYSGQTSREILAFIINFHIFFLLLKGLMSL
jgi:hypothetical protein